MSFNSEVNGVVSTGIEILLFNASTFEPKVCAIPVCLWIRTILSLGKIFNTFNSSVSLVLPDPTLIDPPTEIVLGIWVNVISWTRPAELPTVMLAAKLTLFVDTPTLKESVKFLILVLNPDIDTASWSLISMKGL